ncbi:hypothetical protein GCM10019016_081370 [Streptomyces prasinosporus]|uniref:Trypsin-co-occurring domain-containing protein n=1 Tax=Streptomyces prasinosporus TaxID=68256 RepID=A0ABP6U1L0_9ACTN|nr:hypothetical protein GCM10010332_51590 [Streptomyces albogriseolus]
MIGLTEAMRATYDELTAAANGGANNPLRFGYSSIELEMTTAMSDSGERQGGLKV